MVGDTNTITINRMFNRSRQLYLGAGLCAGLSLVSYKYFNHHRLSKMANDNIDQRLHPKDGSIVSSNGTKKWYVNGELHRDDGPAVEYEDGSKSWYLNGNLHRENGPAIEYVNGHKEWYINGEYQREVRSYDVDKGQEIQ